MPIKTSSAKQKGRALQQLVRDAILAKFKDLEPEDVRSTGMGQSGVDVQMSPKANKLFPYSIECKSRAKIGIYEFYEQAVANKGAYEPLLIIKANRKRPLVVLDLEYFMRL